MRTSSISRNFIMFLALTSIILTACEKLELDKEFTVKIGESKKINSHLSFKIDSLWDSRCPANVFCFTGGNVTLFFNIKQSRNHVAKVVSLNENLYHPFSYDGYLWKILEVNSYPFSSETLYPIDYTIKMVITKD